MMEEIIPMTKIKLNLENYPGDVDKRILYISKSSIDDIFTSSFMKKHTKFSTFSEFCESINLNYFSEDDTERLYYGEFNDAIRSQSDFKSWRNMVETAYQSQINQK